MAYVNVEAGEVMPNRPTRTSVSLSELSSTPVQRRACRGVDMVLSLAHYLVCEGTMPLALPRFEDVNATPHDVLITLTALVRATRYVRRECNKDRVSLQHVSLAILVGWESDALRYCRARPHRQAAAGRPFPRLPSTGYLADDIVVEVRGVIMSKMV